MQNCKLFRLTKGRPPAPGDHPIHGGDVAGICTKLPSLSVVIGLW